ncbi:MAG: sialate O-acetylesterase [Cyclobacteriaceae bacterium]
MKALRAFAFGFLLLLGKEMSAQIKLPKLMQDGVVLQRDKQFNLWGWASPKEKITIQLNGKEYKGVADAKGSWEIIIPKQKAGGPFEITFKGKNEITLRDVLIGDVWVCSGQSNMELTMQRLRDKYPEVIVKSENKFIRQFLVDDAYDFKKPQQDFENGSWQAANPSSILSFTAVGYFFARELYEKYHVPIGLINASLGGSPVESWMSEESLKDFPSILNEYKKFQDDQSIRQIETADKKRIDEWYKELNRKDKGLSELPKWKAINTDDSRWPEMSIPGFWSESSLKQVNGSVWFRKKFVLPASMKNKILKLWLGRIVDQDSVFVNGEFVGTTGYHTPRKYEIAPDILREGENIIAIRVINSWGSGGFVQDKPYFVAADNDTISLKGTWKYNLGAPMTALEGPTAIRWKPVGLYNKMISPLLNFSIKGVIWYQGESNTIRAEEYRKLFPLLISDWREKWKQGDFPFLFVQLANFMQTKSEPSESNWAELRDAQRKTLSLPNTAMAVTIDIGEWNDIHPLNKKEVGHRLVLAAERVAYDEKKIVHSGPIYKSMKIINGKIELSFKNIGSGLIARGNELKYFSIAGADKKFYWAKASIKRDKVIVRSELVKAPIAVRYAWADNPEGANLYNYEGLPASPFSTE